ncbi:hypothetical protein LguiB_021041 [Lonicera macranthoides]
MLDVMMIATLLGTVRRALLESLVTVGIYTRSHAPWLSTASEIHARMQVARAGACGKVNEVLVIRIYGSTPAGQKTCLHVHRALPYLYVPCSDLLLQPDQGDVCTNVLSLAIEKALKLKGNAGSKRQHVHDCSLVRAKKFYGYHSSEELFAKIYLALDKNLRYYPQDVSRAANPLLGGAVLDKIIQSHESHIPFLRQFLVITVFLDQALVSNDTDNCNIILKNHGLLLSSLFIVFDVELVLVNAWSLHAALYLLCIGDIALISMQ